MSEHYSRLRKNQEARLSALERKKADKQEDRRVEETAGFFTKELEVKKNVITSLLEEADGLGKDELPSHFGRISSKCQNLQKFVSDSTLFLTSYDIKTSQQQISELLQMVSSKQDTLLPKKKFAFSSRKKESALKPETEVKGRSEPRDAEVKGHDEAAAGSCNNVSIRDMKGTKIEMTSDEIRGQDVHLSGLEECKVKLFGSASTLHLTNIRRSRVFSGPVASSIFIESCSDCVFVVSCQQLRVHSTSSSQFSLHVTSRAIIEDCKLLTFAPYSWTYLQIANHYEESGLDRTVNNWQDVYDFNWLASHAPSPNWSVLAEEERTNYSE